MNRTALLAIAALALGAGLSACGSSTAPGVHSAPSGGPTSQAYTPAASTATSTSATATTATTPTPTSGPLSTEPKVQVPSGAPPTHLVVKDLVVGTGATVKSGSQVTVNYVGVLYKTGKTFSASWTSHQTFGPFRVGAGAVIPGWDEGLIGMRVRGRRELIIPPSLAYKAAGRPPTIPGNATLIFVVDLLAVH
jgi:peptidylprolyl isomerase